MVTVGLSSWSLHRSLTSGAVRLEDVPGEMRQRGLTDLQVCHFHLQPTAANVQGLRRRLSDAGVTLDAMLLDFGDLASEAGGAQDAEEMKRWLDVAAQLEARHARISAGRQAFSESTCARASAALLKLSAYGAERGVTVVTENWQEMMPSSREVLEVLKRTQGKVPLCLDFGNWSGERKYAELEAIAADSVTVHAKCAFDATGKPDKADFLKCLRLLEASDYEGCIALIYDGPSSDEWAGLEVERKLVRLVIEEDESEAEAEDDDGGDALSRQFKRLLGGGE